MPAFPERSGRDEARFILFAATTPLALLQKQDGDGTGLSDRLLMPRYRVHRTTGPLNQCLICRASLRSPACLRTYRAHRTSALHAPP